jgi:hypothetical protein
MWGMINPQFVHLIRLSSKWHTPPHSLPYDSLLKISQKKEWTIGATPNTSRNQPNVTLHLQLYVTYSCL